MTREQIEREERAKRARNNLERYDFGAIIVSGAAGACAGAIGAGELMRAYELNITCPSLYDLLIMPGGCAGAMALLYIREKVDPIKRYLERKAEKSESEKDNKKTLK